MANSKRASKTVAGMILESFGAVTKPGKNNIQLPGEVKEQIAQETSKSVGITSETSSVSTNFYDFAAVSVWICPYLNLPPDRCRIHQGRSFPT